MRDETSDAKTIYLETQSLTQAGELAVDGVRLRVGSDEEAGAPGAAFWHVCMRKIAT